jgi:low affinity Fe/Cu permease
LRPSLWYFSSRTLKNRDAKAVDLKLDELIYAVHGARNSLINLENLSDKEPEVLVLQFERLQKRGDAHSPTRHAP